MVFINIILKFFIKFLFHLLLNIQALISHHITINLIKQIHQINQVIKKHHMINCNILINILSYVYKSFKMYKNLLY